MHIQQESSLTQSDITQITNDVFQTMLGLPVKPVRPSAAEMEPALTASVHFAGEWTGALLLRCGVPQALGFTSLLMPGQIPLAVDDDVRDTMGELANMIGGNLKPLLPSGVALSMPSVVEGSDYAVHFCKGKDVQSVSFQSMLGHFSIIFAQAPPVHPE